MRGWLACKQSGEEFEELVVPMFDDAWEKRREGDEFAPSLGKVPILWDGDIVVLDSLAIIEFLADRYGTALYWPEEEGARAVARSMSAESATGRCAGICRDSGSIIVGSAVWPSSISSSAVFIATSTWKRRR